MRKFISSLAIITGILGFIATPLFAYVINGQVDDWGMDLSQATAKGYLDTHLPSGGLDIDVAHEDNTDASIPSFQVGPGWSSGNLYDAEAIYFDNDRNYAYFAVITGLPKTGTPWQPGDIFFDVGSNGTYDYGLKYDDGKLYEFSSSQGVYYDGVNHWPDFSISNPWRIVGNQVNTVTEFQYSQNPVNAHYVLEGKVPLKALGLNANWGEPSKPISLHWTMQCGNDYLNLNADVNPTPEPATLWLLGLGLLGVIGRGRRNRNIKT